MARDGKRDPNSMNQKIMDVFFGSDAKNQSSVWSKWPEPQRSIYSRMFKRGFLLAKSIEIKKLKETAKRLTEVLSEV